MPSVYANQFDIMQDKADARLLLQDLDGRVRDWIADRYRAKWSTVCEYPAMGATTCPLPQHSVFRSHMQATDELELRRIRWVHPDGSDQFLKWTTEIVIARCGSRVQFEIQIGVTSTSFIVQPTKLSIGRPRIVTDILRSYSCWAGPQPLVASKQSIVAADLPGFLDAQLLDPKRVIPFIVVSCDRFSDRPVVDPDRMQDTLQGFAQVAVVDKWASFKLTECLGKPLSCYNGCVRVYWPGLKRTSDPLLHWLYFPAQLERFEYLQKPLDRRLFAFLAQLSVFRYTEGDVVRAVHAAINQEKQAEVARIHLQIAEGRAAAKSLHDLEELLQLSEMQNDELRQVIDELQEERDELHRRLRDVQANFALIQRQQALEAEGEGDERPLDFDTVSDALAAAEEDFGADLMVLESARRSAAGCDFPRPDEVYKALMAISEIGRMYFTSPDSIGSWTQQFRNRNFTQYSPTESDTVKNDYKNYGKYRKFSVRGAKRQIWQHLDLGGGDRKACLQIYFEADRTMNKVIVAHCGRHLPIPTDRT